MIDVACMAISQVSGIERFDRLWWTLILATRPINEGLEGLVKHRGAPTCVETHVKTSLDSVRTIYRLLLIAWTHAE